ncbi:hypothetical protein F5Y14DRAFT_465515 [Nemania sp. NC0429]|nr:hypothetical protein F5Y14DRAFT_465515 [Nemania sp. NC0429]
MGNPETPTPCSLGGRHSNDSQKSAPDARQPPPQVLLPPDDSKSKAPSRRVLSICMQPRVLLPSPTPDKTIRKPVLESITEQPSTPPKSIMALRLDRLKDQWQGFKTRASPSVFRFAGHVFLGIVLIAFACVIFGWYGMAKDTASHEKTTTAPTKTGAVFPGYYQSLCPAVTESPYGQYCVLSREVPKHTTSTTTTTTTTTTRSDEHDEVTTVRTVTVTVTITITNVMTHTALKTVTTTELVASACTTTHTTKPPIGRSTETTEPSASTTDSVTTSHMYCSFTGRDNIYTPCAPLAHTEDSPSTGTGTGTGMPASAPPVKLSSSSSAAAAHGMKNPLGTVRLKMASLWNSIPGLGRGEDGNGGGGGGSSSSGGGSEPDCDCDCIYMRRELLKATYLTRAQKRLIESQNSMLDWHKEKLEVALQALANMTAARLRAAGGRELGLNI